MIVTQSFMIFFLESLFTRLITRLLVLLLELCQCHNKQAHMACWMYTFSDSLFHLAI